MQMPRYDYRCTPCNSVFELKLPISEYDTPQNCPVCQTVAEQIITAPGLGCAVRMGFQKPPADFQKYVLGKIKAANPNTTIGGKNSKFGPLAREV